MDNTTQENLFEEMEITSLESFDDSGIDWSGFEQIEDIVGFDLAWKLAEAFAGTTIYIPKNLLSNKKYHIIRRKHKAGSSYRELAKEFGYTDTHIRNIIHKRGN